MTEFGNLRSLHDTSSDVPKTAEERRVGMWVIRITMFCGFFCFLVLCISYVWYYWGDVRRVIRKRWKNVQLKRKLKREGYLIFEKHQLGKQSIQQNVQENQEEPDDDTNVLLHCRWDQVFNVFSVLCTAGFFFWAWIDIEVKYSKSD